MADSEQTILIYSSDQADTKLVSYCCRQMGHLTQATDSSQEAEKIIGQDLPSICFVDLNLPRLQLSQQINIVALGDSDRGAAYKILHYNACCFLPRPLSFSAVMLGLLKATSRYGDTNSFVTTAANIANSLKGIKCALQQIYREQANGHNFQQSVGNFCQSSCPNAKTQAELSDADEGYELLSYFSEHGARYCNQAGSCALHRFRELIPSHMAGLSNSTPLDILEDGFAKSDGADFLEKIATLTESYDLFVSQLFDCKNDYCRNHCPQRQEGLDFTEGDLLHVESNELLQGVSIFCREKTCPLDSFFEVFTHKVVQG